MTPGSDDIGARPLAPNDRVLFRLGNDDWELLIPDTVYPPREDTYLLAEALASLREHSGGLAVEIGCGSGAVSMTLASLGWRVEGCDVNPMAVAATRGNADSAGLTDMISVTEGGVGEPGWILPDGAELVVWNLPYLEPVLDGSLEPMEDASMLDIPDGWSDKLLEVITESETTDDCVVVLLHRTDPASPSKPESWLKAGWASRVLKSLRLGEERLEVICYWQPAGGSGPVLMEECHSTMDEAKYLDPSEWGRLLAINQSSGRGRRGSRWETTPGGLACTWVIPITESYGLEPGLLQTSIGSVVSAALGCHCKWPNDLITEDGSKLGGILVEGSTSESAIRVGIGINRDSSKIDGITVAGWRETFEEYDLMGIFKLVDSSLASLFEQHEKVPSMRMDELVRISWRGLANSLSRGVLIDSKDGDLRVVGIDKKGRLEIENSGEVSITDEVGRFDWIIPTD